MASTRREKTEMSTRNFLNYQERLPIEMAWKNREKLIRAAIRLKHAIEADEEINRVLSAEQAKFSRAIQMGESIEAPDIQSLLMGEPQTEDAR
jgi:hypothetical protein